MRYKFILLCCLLYTLPLAAQTFRGTIVDEKGKAIPHASLFIREKKAGIMTDQYGSFNIKLSKGTYHCEASSLSFKTTHFVINQSGAGTVRSIILGKREYSTKVPEKYRKYANPAMPIIQQAINNAPKCMHYIRSYSAKVYMKNRAQLIKIPGIQKVSKSVRQMAKLYQGRLVTEEEEQEVTYSAPCSYKIKTISKTNILPEDINANLNLNTLNIYDRLIYDKLSPIAPEAPNYYKYRLICTIQDGKHTIYKIHVLPRHWDSVLINGFIYIVDGLWCISAYEFLIYNNVVAANISVKCSEVNKNTFLPICQHTDLNYHHTGFQAKLNIAHSISYQSIKHNTWGDTFSNKDFYLPGKHRFERLTQKDLTLFTQDTMAFNRDSLKWDTLRTTPLLAEEEESYKTIPPQIEKPFHAKDWKDIVTWWDLLVKGDKFTTKNGNQWLKCYKVTTVIPDFNFVDGLWLGYKFGLGTKISKSSYLEFTPAIYFTTARLKWVHQTDLSLYYAPRYRVKFSIGEGTVTADYNLETGESRMFNAVSALIYADNYIKLFLRRYFTISNEVEIANGLLFTTSATWEKREQLTNNIHHSLLGGKAEVNAPHKDASFIMPTNKVIRASLQLEYTPGHYYKMVNGEKMYEQTSNPTFILNYTKAYAWNGAASAPHYNKIQASVRQNIPVGLFNHFVWGAEGGFFYNRHDMQFPDYHHFPTCQNTSSQRPFSYGFFLLDCYTYSTDDRWMMFNATWNTPYLLLKYLPIFRHKKFDESFHWRFLSAPDAHLYCETGYSCGVVDKSRVGFFISFDQGGYHAVGVSLTFGI